MAEPDSHRPEWSQQGLGKDRNGSNGIRGTRAPMSPLRARAEVLAAHTRAAGRPASPGHRSPASWVSLVQGAYLLLTGLWPLVHVVSYQLVSGPRSDLMLVRAFGALTAVIGAVLLVARARRRLGQEILLLGLGSALAFAALDVAEASRSGRVSASSDAVLQLTLVAAWAVTWLSDARAERRRTRLCNRQREMAQWN